MKIEPRRTDRKLESSQEMELLLEKSLVGRFAMNTEDGPYLVAVNHLFFDGSVYFHSASEGRKMEALQADPRVCFMVDEVGPQVLSPRGCGISQIYRSVICFGKAALLTDAATKREILERMIRKFVPPAYPVSPMAPENIEKTAIVRIAIDSMSGKANELLPAYTVLEWD
jgi:uncharacterized protein